MALYKSDAEGLPAGLQKCEERTYEDKYIELNR